MGAKTPSPVVTTSGDWTESPQSTPWDVIGGEGGQGWRHTLSGAYLDYRGKIIPSSNWMFNQIRSVHCRSGCIIYGRNEMEMAAHISVHQQDPNADTKELCKEPKENQVDAILKGAYA